jgi:hypothetical protein
MFPLRCRQADIVATVSLNDTSDKLSQVLLLPVINYHRWRSCRRFKIADVVVTGKQLVLYFHLLRVGGGGGEYTAVLGIQQRKIS